MTLRTINFLNLALKLLPRKQLRRRRMRAFFATGQELQIFLYFPALAFTQLYFHLTLLYVSVFYNAFAIWMRPQV